MGLLKVVYGISMGFLWNLEGFPLNSYGISLGILWGFNDISIGFLLFFLRLLSNFRRISMGMKKDFNDLFMIFPWDPCAISIGLRFLWNLYGISMVFLWDFFGFPRKGFQVSMVFLLDFGDICMEFRGISIGISKKYL